MRDNPRHGSRNGPERKRRTADPSAGSGCVRRLCESRSRDTTYVTVRHDGFAGNGDEMVNSALDSTAGFALVLAACKAYLEHGIQLNIVADRV